MFKKTILIFFLAFVVSLYALSDSQILNTLEEETDYYKKNLKQEEYGPPFFLQNRLSKTKSYSITASLGVLDTEDCSESVYVNTNSKYGDYKFNGAASNRRTVFRRTGDEYFNDEGIFTADAVKIALWHTTDAAYKNCISNYLYEKSDQARKVQIENKPDFFSREDKFVWKDEKIEFHPEPEKMKEIIKEVSLYLKQFTWIQRSYVTYRANNYKDYLVNSEGSRIIRNKTIYYLAIFLGILNEEDGMPLSNYKDFSSSKFDGLPAKEEAMKSAENLVEELKSMKKAKKLNPQTAPAILGPEVASSLFITAVGEPSVWNRGDEEDHPFKDKIDKKIIPNFLSVTDDPLMESFSEKDLLGHYKYDSEGIPAKRVNIVKDGKFKNYLLSRTPAIGFSKSNGHAGGVSNLIIDSKKSFEYSKLRKMLIEECKKQDKDYGFIVLGLPFQSSSDIRQAFVEYPRLIYRIDAETGSMEMVRGIEIVGTALATINKIVATGKKRRVTNFTGYNPKTTVCPYLLLSELEFQKSYEYRIRPPLLKPPYEKGVK